MSSSITVPVCRVSNVRVHPNADTLGIIDVMGYQMVTQLVVDPAGDIERLAGRYRHRYREGELVVYVPADSILPESLIESLGVRNYLKGDNRVGRVRLRGEPSFGLVMPLPAGVTWQEGDNVADHYGITKWEPPVKCLDGDAAAPRSGVPRYTDIENGRLHSAFEDGEEVIVTEKIHGSNCKVGFVGGEPVASSMDVNRRAPMGDDGQPLLMDHPAMANSRYWFPWTIPTVRYELTVGAIVVPAPADVLLYGEVCGGSVQSLDYGVPKGKGLAFYAFDLMVNGAYIDAGDFIAWCERRAIPHAPVIYRGPYSLAKMKELADGMSTVPGANHIREGVVVKPVVERTHPRLGRVVLKFIGNEYALSKHQERDTKDV